MNGEWMRDKPDNACQMANKITKILKQAAHIEYKLMIPCKKGGRGSRFVGAECLIRSWMSYGCRA